MKGGLTWAGWLAVGAGVMLVYSGMTGQSIVGALSSVLSGKSPKDNPQAHPIQVAPTTPGSSGQSGFDPGNGWAGSGVGGSSSGSTGAPHPATIPNPTYPAPGGGSGSW